MTRYHQQVCTHCQGSGVIKRHKAQPYTCPLCYGKGTINDFMHPIEETGERRAPPPVPSRLLLAKTTPLGRKPTITLVTNWHGSWRPRRSTSSTLGEHYEPVAGEPIKTK